MALDYDSELTERVIGLAIEVHRHLGPGLLESAYEECLCFELGQAEIGSVSLAVPTADIYDSLGRFTWLVSMGLFHRWEPDRLFMVWTVYLDETGTHRPSPIVCLGGFLASAEQWQAFDQEWSNLRAAHNLDYSHAVQLAHGKGQFKGWSNARRDDFITGAREVMNKNLSAGFAAILRRDDYNDYYKSQKKPKKIPEDTMLGVLFRGCVSLALALVSQEHPHFQTVNFILESGGMKPGYGQQIYNRMKDDRIAEPALKAMLGPVLGFARKQDSPGCQAADLMLGGVYRQELTEHGTQHSIIEQSSFAGAIQRIEQNDVPSFRIPVSRDVLQSLRKSLFVEEGLRRDWADQQLIASRSKSFS